VGEIAAAPNASRRRADRSLASYGRLLLAQVRVSVTVAAAYRFQFLLDGLLAVVWMAVGILPAWVALHGRPPVGGWTFDGALVVFGLFAMLKAVLDGAVNPSLVAIVDHIRNGTLDFLLIKPKDAQFLATTSKFELWRGLDLLAGAAVVAWAFKRMHAAPSPAAVALALLLLVCATVILYSVWLLVVTAAFWVVRLDNLAYLFNAIFDFARWPRSVMKGALAFVFTFVLPLAVMTSYPAEALLGTLRVREAVLAALLALFFAALSRFTFRRALSRYTSASS
jgi:ABC-2 type transport system permease protein